jgi:hypothetical protein
MCELEVFSAKSECGGFEISLDFPTPAIISSAARLHFSISDLGNAGCLNVSTEPVAPEGLGALGNATFCRNFVAPP